jgi:hypothetical protein
MSHVQRIMNYVSETMRESFKKVLLCTLQTIVTPLITLVFPLPSYLILYLSYKDDMFRPKTIMTSSGLMSYKKIKFWKDQCLRILHYTKLDLFYFTNFLFTGYFLKRVPVQNKTESFI